MKKLLILGLVLMLSGCATINMPNYIQDVNPYKKTFYGSFDEILNGTTQMLGDYGWKVTNADDPSVFERVVVKDSQQDQQILLFTEVRQSSWFLGSRFTRLNAYVKSKAGNTVEVELRYMTITSVLFKEFYKYKNDAMIDRMFTHIESLLNE